MTPMGIFQGGKQGGGVYCRSMDVRVFGNEDVHRFIRAGIELGDAAKTDDNGRTLLYLGLSQNLFPD